MSLLVKIRKNETGEVRTYEDKEFVRNAVNYWTKDYGEHAVYSAIHHMWGEGNYSCDCNRELFFLRAADEDEPGDEKCGDSRYSILEIKDSDTGEVFYDEEADKLHRSGQW